MMRRIVITACIATLSLHFAGCTSAQSEGEDSTELSDAINDVSEDVDGDFTDDASSGDMETAESEPPAESSGSDDLDLEETPADQAQSEPPAEDSGELEDLSDNVAQPDSKVEQLPTEPPAAIDTPAPAPSGPFVEVTNIEYLANQSGGTVVIRTTGSPTFQTRSNAGNNQFIVEINNASLPDNLRRPYIMKDFTGAFGAINAYQNPGSNTVRVVIQQKGSGGFPTVQAEGNSLLVIPTGGSVYAQTPEETSDVPAISAAPVQTIEQEERILAARTLDEFLMGNNRYYGKQISIEFSKDADVRDVINFIAEESGVNIVMSEEVKGNLSVKLRRVPWDQALVIVMQSKKLGYVRQGNVIRISTLDQLQAEASSAKSIIDAQRALEPLKVKVIPVSFSKVEDMSKQVEAFLTKDRGKVVSDIRTSSLIVTDTDSVLAKVTSLVRELDIPPAQVMIEGKVVEASEDFTQTIGVNWGFTGSPVSIGTADLRPSLSVRPIDSSIAATGQLGVNVGVLDVLGNLSATLALAEKDSLAKIISSPRVVTINKEPAEIVQSGEVISITTTSNSGTLSQTVNRTPVVLSLKVTPQITNDGSVIMDVDVQRQFAGPLEDRTTLARAVNSRSAKTKVLVNNGQTAVIGGIYQNDDTTAETGVPTLKDIPVLGWLFKGKETERHKNELLIFLTPRILNIKDQGVPSNATGQLSSDTRRSTASKY